MKHTRALLALALILGAAAAAPAAAQQAADAAPAPWRPLRVAKWSSVGVSVGAALYGFSNNRRADATYEQLEAVCHADVTRCAARAPDGSFSDPALEAEFQRVRQLDRRARSGLVLGQAAVAASVVLFILDLRNEQPPPNIPYEPSRLRIGPARDGGVEIVARWRR